MKTTIDLPDALMRKAKRYASESGVTFKMLVIRGLEHTLASAEKGLPDSSESEFLTTDSYGVPVLKSSKSKKTVTNDLIDDLREELEI